MFSTLLEKIFRNSSVVVKSARAPLCDAHVSESRAQKSRSCFPARAIAAQTTRTKTCCNRDGHQNIAMRFAVSCWICRVFLTRQHLLRSARSASDVKRVTVLNHPPTVRSAVCTDDRSQRNSSATVALGPRRPSDARNVAVEKNFFRPTSKRDIFATLRVEKRVPHESDPTCTMRTPVARRRRDNDPQRRSVRHPKRVRWPAPAGNRRASRGKIGRLVNAASSRGPGPDLREANASRPDDRPHGGVVQGRC